jgi:hypothetical protein
VCKLSIRAGRIGNEDELTEIGNGRTNFVDFAGEDRALDELDRNGKGENSNDPHQLLLFIMLIIYAV